MKLGWIGFHLEGLKALRALLERGCPVEAVITLPPELAAKKSGAADYSELCREFGVPLHEVPSINDERCVALLKELDLDVAFVIGWTELVRPETLRLARRGMVGAHASLLPELRGRAPINWALIRGLKQTGNTLMWLSEGADRGDIIDQTVIPINDYDTCDTLYQRVAESNCEMILRLLPKLIEGERPGTPQEEGNEPDLPARRPQDGLIDWSQDSVDVYNVVRALTRPYPGAFSYLNGQRWLIWEAALLPDGLVAAETPGVTVGSVCSPSAEVGGQLVACQRGGVVLTEVESSEGDVLRGTRLSEQNWTGMVWSNE